MGIDAYPLTWPEGWKRTPPARRVRAKFSKGERQYSSAPGGGSRFTHRDITIADGVRRVLAELDRLGVAAGDSIISTNVRVRLDGLPYSTSSEPDDPGAAVYWRRRKEASPRCMAIDRYDRVADNLAAIAATLNAMRAIERHGGAVILERAFTGFTALPPPGKTAARGWRDVLATEGEIESAIVLGTLKTVPQGLPPTYQAEVLARGEIMTYGVAKAAAMAT